MIANFIYPTFMLLKKLKMPAKHLQHTMPYMEANNFLSFVRENMLLATVVDSFCINNTVSFSKHANKGKGIHVTYGRLMGTLTFFLQDFPQFSIHAYFKVHPYVFAYPPVHYHLKAQTLLLISMIVSGIAVCISCFNMIMCVENIFNRFGSISSVIIVDKFNYFFSLVKNVAIVIATPIRISFSFNLSRVVTNNFRIAFREMMTKTYHDSI